MRELWYPILQQKIPHYNDPEGVVWNMPLPDTSLIFTKSGLIMQQTRPGYYAELDLNQVNGRSYNQKTFRVQVQVIFLNPTDVTTGAALIVQTPTRPVSAGGYMFVLNSVGQWKLLYVMEATRTPTLEKGFMSIEPNLPTTLSISVRENIITGSINNSQAVNYNVNYEPLFGAAVGLMVIRPRILQPYGMPSSPVIFSNFQLDMWGTSN